MESTSLCIWMERRMKGMLLEEKLEKIISEYGFFCVSNSVNVYDLVKEAIDSFMPICTKPAVWCYGYHTKMLMADFMCELKAVQYIIDERADDYQDACGFKVIRKEDIVGKGINGILISSYKFRGEIKEVLQQDYPDIPYLDLYEYIEQHGVCMDKEYYAVSHPASRYQQINSIQLQLERQNDKKEELYFQLIGCLIGIRDISLAASYARKLYQFVPSARYRKLAEDLAEIYDLECQFAGTISGNNVLMLCIDGLRDRDISEQEMPNFVRFVKGCYRFENAYSTSTSTYESLVPTYSENTDMRTKYYESICVAQGDCRFIQKANEQKRNIFFYTDFVKYVEGENIERAKSYQTASEKIWNFIVDGYQEKNGLFYVHILYESHYSYLNPYMKSEMVNAGSNILFDYLQENGGKIRTDYEMQHHAMLNYLDDAIIPILQQVKCRMVIFADHGNIIIDQRAKLEELQPLLFTYHQDLVRIPLIIKSPEMGAGTETKKISLMELNGILISLLEKDRFVRRFGSLVKIQRSEIYNPDFRFLYEKNGFVQGLLAFEAFVFEDGYKLGVYSNGFTELASLRDELITDQERKRELLSKIEKYITVCSLDKIVL